jgi:hypothetical protein
MKINAFYVLFILISVNTSLLSKDLSIEEFNELKTGLKTNEITIDQFNEVIDDLEISSDIFKISKDLFLSKAIELEDYLIVIENSLVSQNPSDSKIIENKNNSNNSNIADNNFTLKFKIVQVGNRVPPSINARVNNIENLTFVMNGDKVKEILYEDKSNNFFSKKIVRSFKNIKIKLVNQTTLKGKSRLVLNEYRSENVVIWWDLNISKNNLSGEVEIELVGRGPQIKLIPVNN